MMALMLVPYSSAVFYKIGLYLYLLQGRQAYNIKKTIAYSYRFPFLISW